MQECHCQFANVIPHNAHTKGITRVSAISFLLHPLSKIHDYDTEFSVIDKVNVHLLRYLKLLSVF